MSQEKRRETQHPSVPKNVSIKRVRSDALLGGSKELIIEHAGREYRLRKTSNGKLILTA